MKLNYISEIISQDIDIEQLRPNKSYDHLIENRNASLGDLMKDKVRLKEFLHNRNCPICESEKHKLILNKDSLDIVECLDCSIIYVNTIFDEEKYNDIYRSKDYQEIIKNLGEESHEYRRKRFGVERVEQLEKLCSDSKGKRLLEIGCSTGFVIEEAASRGWDTIGIELNPSAAQFAKNKKLEIFEQPYEDISFDKKFNAIAMYDVLEHLVDPKSILERAYNDLEDDGVISLYVPNWNAASRQLLGEENAHYIWPTHHLTYFTPETLKMLLEKTGFKIIEWETQGLDIVDWVWYLSEKEGKDCSLIEDNMDALQFYINAAGHGKNLRMYARK